MLSVNSSEYLTEFYFLKKLKHYNTLIIHIIFLSLFGINIVCLLRFEGPDRDWYMLSYEFYWRDEFGETHLIGILPERRKDPHRINNESVMNWVKKVVGDNIKEVNNIFFTQVHIE